MGRPSRLLLRRGALVALVLLGTAALADARGGGGGGGGGMGGGGGGKRFKKGTRASAQVEQLINEAYRRDVFARSRRVDG